MRQMSLAVSVSLVWVTPLFSQESSEEIATRLVKAAIERTTHEVPYDGSYRRIDYPGGDVPDGIGVCTDVLIRSYRGVGIDLQEAVHEDMSAAFSAYPTMWGLKRPDSNIDHRRVPNLQVFFRRNGTALPILGTSAGTDCITFARRSAMESLQGSPGACGASVRA